MTARDPAQVECRRVLNGGRAWRGTCLIRQTEIIDKQSLDIINTRLIIDVVVREGFHYYFFA